MIYTPDFDEDCYICGSSPCVVVTGHLTPHTRLCGPCFFKTPKMVDWEEWNIFSDEADDQ